MVKWMIERRKDTIHPTTGISVDHYSRIVLINTDAGRFMIPLVPADCILDTKKEALFNAMLMEIDDDRKKGIRNYETWDKLLREGFVEYLDANMLDNATLAWNIKDLLKRRRECTHLCLPCQTVGIIQASVVGSDMNRGNRNLLLCNHVKQGIGLTIKNWSRRYLNEMDLLRRAQDPLVRSEYDAIIGIDRYPNVENLVIAFMSAAENQADALIANQGAVDRGMLQVHHLRSIAIKPEDTKASFGLHDLSTVYTPVAPEEAYKQIDPEFGIPTAIGASFKKGDVLAAITLPLPPPAIDKLKERMGGKITITRKDASILYDHDHCPSERHPTPGTLTAAYTALGANKRARLLQFDTERYLKAGDKSASRHAQKGVFGAIWPEWKIPYTADGVRPCILFNPEAIVRRETHGQPFEALVGKICALFGTSIAATPFLHKIKKHEISKLLLALGFSERGEEVMYDPVSGRQFTTPIFVGTTSQIRHHRMVDDLIQIRNHGPKESFSRQPTKGRNKGGGVKMDEMTVRALIASGSMQVLRDSTVTQCAPHTMYICEKCGGLCYPSPRTPKLLKCDKCGLLDPAVPHKIYGTYNIQLLYCLLLSTGIFTEIITESSCKI
jgi:DNA-directed RNA polymerase subunit B